MFNLDEKLSNDVKNKESDLLTSSENEKPTTSEPQDQKGDPNDSERGEQFVHFNYVKGSEPELVFRGTFDPVYLSESVRKVIKQMKDDNCPGSVVNKFLQLACTAFGLPTNLANSGNDPDDVSNVISGFADQIESMPFGKESRSIGEDDE